MRKWRIKSLQTSSMAALSRTVGIMHTRDSILSWVFLLFKTQVKVSWMLLLMSFTWKCISVAAQLATLVRSITT